MSPSICQQIYQYEYIVLVTRAWTRARPLFVTTYHGHVARERHTRTRTTDDSGLGNWRALAPAWRPLLGMPFSEAIDPAFFEKYDSMKQSIADADEEVAAKAESASKQAARDLEDAKVKLTMVRARQQHHKDKLAKCEKAWTLLTPDTWLTGGISGRIQRQTKKLGERSEEVGKLTEAETELESAKKTAVLEARKATQAVARKEQHAALCLEMLNAVVEQFATPQLKEMRKESGGGSELAARIAAEKERAFEIARKKICEGMEIKIAATVPVGIPPEGPGYAANYAASSEAR